MSIVSSESDTQNADTQRGRRGWFVAMGAVAACAAACAGMAIAVTGGVGAVAAVAAGWWPVAVVLAAGAGAVVIYGRRRRSATQEDGCGGACRLPSGDDPGCACAQRRSSAE